MATLNVSDKQKQHVVKVQKLVDQYFPVKISQADVVEMGMVLVEEKFSDPDDPWLKNKYK